MMYSVTHTNPSIYRNLLHLILLLYKDVLPVVLRTSTIKLDLNNSCREPSILLKTRPL